VGSVLLVSSRRDLWLLHGDMGRSADAYMRAAALMEDSSPTTSVEYVMQAIDLLSPENDEPLPLSKAPMATEVINKALNLCLRNDKIEEAYKVSERAGKLLSAQQMHSSLYKVPPRRTTTAVPDAGPQISNVQYCRSASP